jgi:autotransporter-associated beta strand protein
LATVLFTTACAEDWTPIWTTATLSQARQNLSATSAGGLVFFAGGDTSSGDSNVVDIYNTSTSVWSTATLSQARNQLAATSVGNQVFFAGGQASSGISSVVDIYNTSTNTWSTASLSQARVNLAATSVGNAVFFAGGLTSSSVSNVVDIYNTSTNIWSTTNLSQARYDVAATSADGLVFFGGGYSGSTYSSVVDIYNTSTNTWSTASLLQPTCYLAATSAGNQVFFAGGDSSSGLSNVVNIYNTSTNTWSAASLSQARYGLAAASVGNKVLFAGGSVGSVESNVIDIYDTSTNTWSFTTLSQARGNLAATSAGNQVFFAGGYTSSGDSNVVDIYTLQSYPTITSSKAWTLVDQTTVAGRMQLNAPGSLALSTFNLNVGSMSGNAPIDVGSQTLTVGSDNTSNTYSGIISDGGNLLKTGSGILVLNANNTYTGLTSVVGGTLALATVNALSPASSITITGGVLDLGGLSQTTSSAISVQCGTIQNGTLTATGGAFNFQAGVVSANLAGSVGLTKSGNGMLTLSGSNSYTGGTVVSQGTLNLNGGALTGGGNIQLAAGTTLIGSGIVQGNIIGVVGSTITASGSLVLGDSTSYTGYNHAGTLMVGPNTVTLNSTGFANLGVLTTLSGGTVAAPNGVTIPLGGNLVGSGAVNGKIAAGYGSTIQATGNLTLGDSTSPVGFTSDGELYTNGNTVTLNSANAANNKNAVVLGSLTKIDGGGVVAPNGILLNAGNNLVTTDAGGTVSGGSASRFLNFGNVQGPSSASNNWLTFNMLFKGGTGQTSGRIAFLGGFATGDSPGINYQYGATELGGSGTEFDIGGTTPGNSDNNYGQLNILTDPNDPNNHGDLILSPGTSFNIVDWDGFVPTPGETFAVLSWDGTISGSASLAVDPAFAAEGIQFVPQWNSNSLVLEAVPEPSTLALLGAGTIALIGWAWRRQKVARTAKPSAFDQQDAPAILAFRSHSSPASAARRAA